MEGATKNDESKAPAKVAMGTGYDAESGEFRARLVVKKIEAENLPKGVGTDSEGNVVQRKIVKACEPKEESVAERIENHSPKKADYKLRIGNKRK